MLYKKLFSIIPFSIIVTLHCKSQSIQYKGRSLQYFITYKYIQNLHVLGNIYYIDIHICMLYNILHMYSIKLYTLHLSLHYLLCTVGPTVFNIKVPHCNTLSILPDNTNSMCSIELYSSLYIKSLSKILTLICRSQSVQYKGTYIKLFSSILLKSSLHFAHFFL